MPKYENYKHNRKAPNTNFNDTDSQDGDEVAAESEKWNPTPEVFDAFLLRDFELATRNINMLMRARRSSMTLKELKDSTLHSSDVIERVLSSHLVTGFMTEDKGRYSLVSP